MKLVETMTSGAIAIAPGFATQAPQSPRKKKKKKRKPLHEAKEGVITPVTPEEFLEIYNLNIRQMKPTDTTMGFAQENAENNFIDANSNSVYPMGARELLSQEFLAQLFGGAEGIIEQGDDDYIRGEPATELTMEELERWIRLM